MATVCRDCEEPPEFSATAEQLTSMARIAGESDQGVGWCRNVGFDLIAFRSAEPTNPDTGMTPGYATRVISPTGKVIYETRVNA